MTWCVFLLRFFSFPPARTERVFCKQKVERSKKGAVGEKRKGEKRSRSRLMRRSEESGGKKEEGVEKFLFFPLFIFCFSAPSLLPYYSIRKMDRVEAVKAQVLAGT